MLLPDDLFIILFCEGSQYLLNTFSIINILWNSQWLLFCCAVPGSMYQ